MRTDLVLDEPLSQQLIGAPVLALELPDEDNIAVGRLGVEGAGHAGAGLELGASSMLGCANNDVGRGLGDVFDVDLTPGLGCVEGRQRPGVGIGHVGWVVVVVERACARV